MSRDYLGKSVEIHIAATKVRAFPSPSIPTSRGRHKALRFCQLFHGKGQFIFFSRFSSNKAYGFFFTFCFYIVTGSREVAKKYTEVSCIFIQFPPILTSFIVQYQRQEINIGVIHRTYSVFTSYTCTQFLFVYVIVFMCV